MVYKNLKAIVKLINCHHVIRLKIKNEIIK